MKKFSMTKPTTKQTKISRLVYMVMAVLFAALMCYLCIQHAQMQHFKMEVSNVYNKPADFQYPSDMPYEEYLYQYIHALTYFVFAILETVWYALSAIAILMLCLRCTKTTSWIAWGLSVASAVYALGSRNTDMRLGEYIFLKYHLFPFFSADTNLTIQPYFVPTVAALTIAAATYFLIARLIEHKKAIASAENQSE